MKNNHRWSEEDDIVALYLYKFDDKELPYDVNNIGKKLGMGAFFERISFKRRK